MVSGEELGVVFGVVFGLVFGEGLGVVQAKELSGLAHE